MSREISKIRRSTERIAFLVAAALWVGIPVASLQMGCDAGAKDAQGSHCDTDSDCPLPGEVCSALKVCLPRANGSLHFGLEIKPDSQSENNSGRKLAQFEIPPWEIISDSNGVVKVSYEEAVKLSGGVIVMMEDPTQTQLQATITATRSSRLPGRPKVVVSSSVEALGMVSLPRPQDEVDPSFTMMLTKHSPYSLRAAPLAPFNETYHPTTMDYEMDADSSLNFVFGDTGMTDYFSGTVTDAVGSPVAGVKVKAVDEGNGLFVSTIGVTDDTGTFVLAVPKGYRSYKLTFLPSEANQGIPEVTHDDVSCCEVDNVTTFSNPEHIGVYKLPAFPTPVKYQFSLSGRSSSGSVTAVPEATVTFETTVGHEETLDGTFSVTVSSNADGIVSADLVPGETSMNRTYKVTVTTPVGSEFASEVRFVEVGPQGGAGEQIELQRRVSFSGSVVSMSYEPADITIQARKTGGVEAFEGLLYSTWTDAQGRFLLPLDPGEYTLELVPPTGVPLPRWVLHHIWVDNESQLLQHAGVINIPNAAVLDVEVRSANTTGTLLESINVAVYLVDETCAYDTGDPCENSAVLLGSGLTNDAGRARIIVPQPN